MAVLGYLEEVAPADSEQVVDDGDGDGGDGGDGAGGDGDHNLCSHRILLSQTVSST